MALIITDNVNGKRRVNTPNNAVEGASQRFYHTITTAQNVTANIFDLGIIPAGMSVAEIVVDSDDIDSATALVWDLGIMSGLPGEPLDEAGNARTCGAEFFSGGTTGQAAGVARPTLKTAYRVTPNAKDRSIGLKITTQSGTAVEGEFGITVTYRQ